MAFILSSDARGYFREINKKSDFGELDTVWDQYYFSAMIGFRARKRVPEDDEPSEEPFTTDVILPYQDQKYEIYSAMVVAEIERKGIPWNEQDEIKELMMSLLDSESHTRLTPHGATILNCYAERGSKIIRKEIPTPPPLEEFIEDYHALLDRGEDLS